MSRKEEIERKFRVHQDQLPPLPPGAELAQGYLSFTPNVRVRTEIAPGGARKAYLTVKGPGLVGRDEFEYEIPFEEGDALLGLAQSAIVRKTRHLLPADPPDLKWELDVFAGENEGLIVAEIEIPAADQHYARPDWLADDVTEDPAYKNSALSQHPYREWGEKGEE
jgi:CYTH domain-containing protein